MTDPIRPIALSSTFIELDSLIPSSFYPLLDYLSGPKPPSVRRAIGQFISQMPEGMRPEQISRITDLAQSSEMPIENLFHLIAFFYILKDGPVEAADLLMQGAQIAEYLLLPSAHPKALQFLCMLKASTHFISDHFKKDPFVEAFYKRLGGLESETFCQKFIEAFKGAKSSFDFNYLKENPRTADAIDSILEIVDRGENLHDPAVLASFSEQVEILKRVDALASSIIEKIPYITDRGEIDKRGYLGLIGALYHMGSTSLGSDNKLTTTTSVDFLRSLLSETRDLSRLDKVMLLSHIQYFKLTLRAGPQREKLNLIVTKINEKLKVGTSLDTSTEAAKSSIKETLETTATSLAKPSIGQRFKAFVTRRTSK